MNEAELLFTEILETNRASLYLNQDKPLPKAKLQLISQALKRRINGEPVQYILGKTEFMGLEFKVTPQVLIPRDDTEILVEKTIDLIKQSSSLGNPKILDLCTGSGCIAISLAKFIKGAKVVASDISQETLDIATENAFLNNAGVNFIKSNLFNSADLVRLSPWDIIVSNPPYVKEGEIQDLEPEVKHEPVIALNGGVDGLDFYRIIISQAHKYLKNEGFLVLEIGFGQSKAIQGLFKRSKNFEVIEVVKDYNNIDRVIIAKYKDIISHG